MGFSRRLAVTPWKEEEASGDKVGRCRLTVSKPELKACIVSALETKL
jgi:hypothetical protein